MPGPPPKDPKLRQRRNKAPTAAKLKSGGKLEAPDLPKRTLKHPETGDSIPVEWHSQAVEFWTDVWESPMAREFVKADTHGLFILVTLIDGYWRRVEEGNVSGANELAKEIRLQRQCFGLTPIDRRRLQWEVEKVEEKKSKRSGSKKPPARPAASRDPRRHLAAVK